MIVDEWHSWNEAHRMLVSQGLREIPGFADMIRKILFETSEQMMGLNPDAKDFNLHYREMQYRKREYEGILKILENPDAT